MPLMKNFVSKSIHLQKSRLLLSQAEFSKNRDCYVSSKSNGDEFTIKARSLLYNIDLSSFMRSIQGKVLGTPKKKVHPWKDQEKVSQANINLKTKYIVGSLADADRPAIVLKRTEELTDHICAYPLARHYALKYDAVKILNKLRHKFYDEATLMHIRQTLAVLGYAEPLKTSGIRILSIDGGGMRGIVVIKMLQQLEHITGKKIIELFDYICGVSTGAIITCCLLPPYAMSLEKIDLLYKNLSAQVFQQNIILGTGKLVWNHAYYDTRVWEELLKSYVHETKLIDSAKYENSPKASVVSTIVNQKKVSPYLFRNYCPPCSDYIGDHSHTIVEAVRASAAAPTIFEEVKIGDYIHQDGGIIVNNPTAVAIHEARNLWPSEKVACVVSCGTGKSVHPAQTFTSNLEASSWKKTFRKILESATDTENVHMILSDMMPNDVYYRINPYLSFDFTMDEYNESKISLLESDADLYFRRNEDIFYKIAAKLTEKRSKTKLLRDYISSKLIQRGWQK